MKVILSPGGRCSSDEPGGVSEVESFCEPKAPGEKLESGLSCTPVAQGGQLCKRHI